MRHFSICVSLFVACSMLMNEVQEFTKSITVASAKSVAPQSLLFESPTSGTKRFIVRFKDSATDAERNKEINDHSARVRQILSSSFNGAILDMTLDQASAMRRSHGVLWVEQDQPVSVQATVTPTPSWGLDRIDQKTANLDTTYSFQTAGAGVDAYVVDTGILLSHKEFQGRIRAGYDAYNQGASDCNGHGTHVAGTLAGKTYGVAPEASLIAVRVLGCDGQGTVSNVIAGIEWAIADHAASPAVLNLSLNSDKSASLESAVDRAFADGITVVVAAGNYSLDACTRSPSGNKQSAITVGATNSSDARDYYSNFGACLDIFAPGSSITSAGIASDSSSSTQTGTSMASPHVAGLAARYLSAVPSATPATVAAAMISSATVNAVTNAGTLSPNRLAFADPELVPLATPTTVNSPAATTSTLPPDLGGSGTPEAPSVPGRTGNPIALSGATSAFLKWSPALDGGTPITSHVVRVYRRGLLLNQVIVDADTVHTIVSLRAGSTYSFTVAAVNGLGAGNFSFASNSVIPLKAIGGFSRPQKSNINSDVTPTAPTKVSTFRAGKVAVIMWSPPTNALVDGFDVFITRGNALLAMVRTTATGGVKIYGLKPGLYSIQVASINTNGTSRKSVTKRLRI